MLSLINSSTEMVFGSTLGVEGFELSEAMSALEVRLALYKVP